jgi:hypothetical protein
MRFAATAWIAVLIGCGSGSSTGTVDASTHDAAQPGCPADQPSDGTACTGSLKCEYGQSTCCGVTSSFTTCQCQPGGFSCAMTVECNFVCPDAGP